jgi:putative tricarboxylic transport membrane protein
MPSTTSPDVTRASTRSPRAAAADLAAFLLLAALGAAAAWRAMAYGLSHQGEPGTGLFPFIAGAFTAVIAVGAFAVELGAPAGAAAAREGPTLWCKLSLYVAVILVWPWLLVPLGFLVSTALALLVVMRFAERMRWAPTLGVLVAAALASWLLFERVLGVPLPRGWLGIG